MRIQRPVMSVFRKLSAVWAGTLVAGIILVVLVNRSAAQQSLPMNDDNFLRMSVVGDHSLRLLNSNVVEVMMVTAKDPDPAPLTSWNFINASGAGSLPSASSFTVSANGQSIPVTGVGFKRRVLYAPLRTRDLRIANWLYLQLGSAIPANAVVSVVNPSASLWSSSVIFNATNSAQRYSPVIHVNQAGYVANFPKKALVGFYLGTMGELAIPSGAGFQVVSAATGATVFTGTLTRHPDVGYSYTPTPYQQVFEADFTGFNTPGEYKIFVPGVGVSFPFFIDEGMAATYARTYALGIYHQRCGTDNVMPYTRHTHGPCHTNLVLIPSSPGPEQDFVNYVLNGESASAANNPRHTAPRMVNVGASLYPFVNTGLIDARGGHHDAGDYSKYTTSVSAFIHYLTFAVDALPGVKDLDNLGLPESGDGISDIIQEAKWEADYLAKLQDADGGFYFIVYPRTRQYELDVTPDKGDTQLVLPKNTAATAAAVGALADIASSPTFKAAYPVAASNYLAKAIKGWQFLQNAIARYGKDGAYQMITFSGDVFMHDDELAWAAAALYTATGDPAYNTALRSYMPNPNSASLRRWDWWSMFGGWGCATRDYAFAARSGRLTSAQIDPAYLALCEAEIKFAGSNSIDWSAKMAYGSSFTDESKGLRVAGWYFSGEWTLDPAAAWVVDSSATTKALYIDTILKNYNYEMGCNPVNVTYLTGLGWKRQREIVHQYALNDYRVLPPGGVPLGNIQAQYDYLQNYKTELSSVSYPLDDSPGQPYAYYDRWADTFNVSTEFVVSQTAKTLPAAAMLMAMTPTKNQVWKSATAQVVNLPASSLSTQPVTPSLTSSIDLSKARIVWEARDQEPYIGSNYTFTPKYAGSQWVEAEAQLPDGRRVVVLTNFTAILQATNSIEQYQTTPLTGNTNVVAWYKLDSNYTDAAGHEPSLTPGGNAFIDNGSFAWPNRPSGAALRVLDLGDKVTVALPNADLSSASSSAISIEAMFYVNRQVAYGRGNANLFVLSKTWNAELAMRHNIWTDGPAITGGATSIANNVALASYLKTGRWQHLKIRLDRNGYTLSIDGQVVATAAGADLGNWGGSGNAAFEIGNFDGWVDEIVVKNEGGGTGTTPPPAGSASVSIITTANANEGTLTPGSFQISRDAVAATNLTVNLTVGGTASSGVDYSPLPTSVIIPAGTTSTTLAIAPLQDTNYEGNETVTMTISTGAGYTVGIASATALIIDDDPDTRPPPPGQTNYISTPTVVNSNVVALYHFDGNLADATGRYANLTLGGAAGLDGSNLSWMNSPAGSGLRVQNLGDKATVTLNNVNLYTAGTTASLGVEAFVFVKKFTGYTVQSSTLFKISKRWDAQMIYNRDTWQQSPELWGGITKMLDVPALAPYIQTNCWQKIGVFLDETGYLVKVNDVEVARTSSADISKWAGAGNVDIEVGSFDGWVDELAIRSNLKGYTPPATNSSQTVTFNALPTKTYGDAAFALTATASSGLGVTFSSGNTAVATVSGNTLTIIGAGTAVITATQAGNGAYSPASATQTLTVNKANATVTLSGLAVTYNGAAKTPTVTTTPGSLPVTITYNGGSTAPAAVGSYAVVATVNHNNYSGSASGTLAISKGTATVTLSGLSVTYDGSPKPVTVATAPSGLSVGVTYNGSSTAPSAVGNYSVVATVNDVNYLGSANGTLVVVQPTNLSQTVTFPALPVKTYGNPSFTLSATCSSGLPVTFSSANPAVATISGSTLTIVGAGTAVITASQSGNVNYNPASASQTLTVNKATGTVTLGGLSAVYGGVPNAVTTITSPAGLPVSITYNGSANAPVNAGSYNVVATINHSNYTGTANGTLTVAQAAQTITFGTLPIATFGDGALTLGAATSSGLPVTYTSGNTTVARISGNSLTILNAGSAVITASRAGNSNYLAATDVSQTLFVGKATAGVTLSGLNATYNGSPRTATATTTPAGLPVSMTYNGGGAPTVVGSYTVVAVVNHSNYSGSASATLTINKATATVGLSGLSVTYDGNPKPVSANTTPAGLSVFLTYNGSSTPPSAVGSYPVVATINEANYAGSASGTLLIVQPTNLTQTISFTALPGKTFGDGDFTLNAAASSGLPVTFSSGNTAVATVSGNTVRIVGAGTVVITASQAGNTTYNPASASQTLTVSKASATVSLSGMTSVYDGASKSPVVTTVPASLPVNVTYNGSVTVPVNAGSYAVAATISHPNYAGSTSGTLSIWQANQTIAFDPFPAKTYGDAAIILNATASSGLPITYASANTNVAKISGNTLTIVGAGTAVITATQSGNANYTAAVDAAQTLIVNKAAATVALSGLNVTYNGSAKTATVATTPSGLPVTVTYNGSSSAPVNVGSYAVIATINSPNYFGSSSDTLTISQPSQTITFSAIPAKTYGVAAFTLGASASSGLPLSFNSDNASVATIAGNVVTIVGAGTAVITATQPGNQNYTAASPVSQTLTVNKATATVTLVTSTSSYDGATKVASVTTVPAGLPVNITYNGSVSGPVNAGSYAVVATVNHNNYSGSASGILTILPATQSISFEDFPDKTFGDAPFALNATASSGLPITFTSGNPSVATVSGNTVTIVGAGSAIITASQGGNGNYSVAGSVSQTLVVSKAAATIALSNLNPTYDGTPKTVGIITIPGGLAATVTYNGSNTPPVNAGSYAVVATITNNNYFGLTTGTQTIAKATANVSLSGLNATYDGSPKSVGVTTTPPGLTMGVTYNGSSTQPSAVGSYAVVATVNNVNYVGVGTGTLLISQASGATSQTISFGALPTRMFGDAPFTVSATASSGLPVTLISETPNVATVSGNTVTIVGAGIAVITAMQSGNSSYNPAPAVSQTFIVNKANVSVALNGLTATYDGSAKVVTATTTPDGIPVGITYNGGSVAPADAGSYLVVVTVNHPNYSGGTSGTLTISKGTQTITFNALPIKAVGDAPMTLNGTASSGLPVTFTSGNPAIARVDGNTLTILSGGTVVITASQPGNGNYNSASSVSRNFTVRKATATVTLSGLSAVYDGTPKPVTATTSPANLSVSITYNGSSTPPVNAGNYTVVATINDNNYSGSATGTLTIATPGTTVSLTVTKQGQGTVSPDFSGLSFDQGSIVTLTAQPKPGWMFDSWAVNGAVVSSDLSLTLEVNASMNVLATFVDASAPVVTVISLITNVARATSTIITISGTASDNTGVQSVEYSLDVNGVASPFQPTSGTTNWWVDFQPGYGTNIFRVRAYDSRGNLSAEAKRTFTYIAYSPIKVSMVGQGTITPNLNGQKLQLGRVYTMTAKPAAGYTFDGWEGGLYSTSTKVSFVMSENLSLTARFHETTRPTVTIASPAANAKVTTNLALIKGTAKDASGIEQVEIAVNGGDFTVVSGTTNWSASVGLQAGTNTLRVRSLDRMGNFSLVTSRSVFYSVVSPLKISIEGLGSVAGATNGQLLEIGRAYKLTATPAAGQIFAEWTGDISWPSNALSFLMQTNLSLEANFVTNPFTPLKGTYQALFYEADQVRHDRSGAIKLTLNPSGTYSATVKLGVKTAALTGSFNWLGKARLNVPMSAGNVVAINLQVDVTNATESLTGIAVGTNWFAEISGYRAPTYAATNPPPVAGRFTFVVPVDDSSSNNPAGLGYGTMTVTSAGLGTLSGKLGDGTAFTVAATISRDGFFPLYSQLYTNKGSTLGWLRFANLTMSDFDGPLSWIKPPTAANTAYSAGFAVNTFCVGSTYVTNATPLLNLTNSPMEFAGGLLGDGFANSVTLLPNGSLQNLSTNKLTFTLTKSTGLFTGTVVNPMTGGSVSYGGAIFQKWNAALGYATIGKTTGAVKLDSGQ